MSANREIVIEIPARALTALAEGNDVRLGVIEPGARVILRVRDHKAPGAKHTRRPVTEPPPPLSP